MRKAHPARNPMMLKNVTRGNLFPYPPVFRILCAHLRNRGRSRALSDDKSTKRGRPSRERHADNMIEQRPPGERRKSSAALDEARLRQQAIGVRLRQMFDQVVNEEVPDEFLDILRRADSRSSEKG